MIGQELNETAGLFHSANRTTGAGPDPITPVPKKLTVVYACSGCSDAGELADRTARSLTKQKLAEMSCLAGIGGRVKSLLLKAERAEDILVIDGCPLNCARNTLQEAGFKQFRHLELHRLGFRKGSCPVTPERIDVVTKAAEEMLAAESPSLKCADAT